jgi:large subunit ribosomal protein L22
MQVKAQLNSLRISPRKVRLVADLIKGQDIEDALVQLKHLVKGSSSDIGKLLKSAIANAENNFGLDRDNLYILDIQVGEGYRMKRWLPRAFGRASQLIKRTSKVTLVLAERIEGKNRKSKEQMEKIKKERAEAKKKLEKELQAERERTEKESPAAAKSATEEEKIPFRDKKSEEEQKKGGRKGWMKKMFQRKAG